MKVEVHNLQNSLVKNSEDITNLSQVVSDLIGKQHEELSTLQNKVKDLEERLERGGQAIATKLSLYEKALASLHTTTEGVPSETVSNVFASSATETSPSHNSSTEKTVSFDPTHDIFPKHTHTQ